MGCCVGSSRVKVLPLGLYPCLPLVGESATGILSDILEYSELIEMGLFWLILSAKLKLLLALLCFEPYDP